MRGIRFIVILLVSALVWSCLQEKKAVEPVVETPTTPTTPAIPSTPTTPTTPPISGCDSVSISFDKTIVPILQNNCTSCHGGSNPSAGIDLTSYTVVSGLVKNGKLYGSITHATGYSPMPSSSQKITDCEVLKIKKWIIAGYPNGAVVIAPNPTNPVDPVVPPVITPTVPTPSPCDPNTVYFQQNILPVIVSNCATAGCHDAKTAREGVVLVDYATIMRNVNISNPTGSGLYKYLNASRSNQMPPAPASALASDKVSQILKWIQQGAKNNTCDAAATNCNVTTATFATVVLPILQNSCTGCHGNITASAGVNLTTYAGVSVVAKNGKLYGSITHATGYFPMPSASSSLSSCEINLVKKWIDAGTKND